MITFSAPVNPEFCPVLCANIEAEANIKRLNSYLSLSIQIPFLF